VASASPSRIPAVTPAASAAAVTGPTSCSRPGSGASAAGTTASLGRDRSAARSSNPGMRRQAIMGGTDVLSNVCSYVKTVLETARRARTHVGAIELAPDGAEALGHVGHCEHPVPGVPVEQRPDVVEHRAPVILGEHGALASGANELDEIVPAEQLHMRERLPLDGIVETALVDARGHGDDTVVAEAPTDHRVRQLGDPVLRVV